MRKALDLDIEAEIAVELDIADDRVAELVDDHRELVAHEVRASAFEPVEDGHRETWTVEGVEMEIAIKPLTEAVT